LKIKPKKKKKKIPVNLLYRLPICPIYACLNENGSNIINQEALLLITYFNTLLENRMLWIGGRKAESTWYSKYFI
jgi:hypothetical protein